MDLLLAPKFSTMINDLSIVTDSIQTKRNEGADDWGANDARVPSLYGRSQETLTLLNTYEQVLQTKTSATVLVHGESGSGKTSLVELLRKTVCDSNGFFCASKYFQNNSLTQEPYSAIMAAFSDLCDLVHQAEDFDEDRRGEIQRKLGADGNLLAKAVIGISHFLKDSEMDEFDLRNEFALVKFKVACKTFLHAMSSETHAIVMFIDDIQWMDASSEQLMDMLLRDTELTNVMLILAYRDEEAEVVDDLLSGIENQDIIDIPIGTLDSTGVHEMVSSALNENSDAVRELSSLVAQKTSGNPLHVMQFFDSVVGEGLLEFDDESQSWLFDVDTIQREMMVSNSLANILLRKIMRLPQEVQGILKVASLLGFRFREEHLLECRPAIFREDSVGTGDESILMGSDTAQSTCSFLNKAVGGRFLEKTRDGYQFSHDKIQSSCRSMIGEAEEGRLHLVIGEMFLRRGNLDGLYQAAVHLNNAPDFVSDDKQRIRLANINLEASKISREKYAFDDAANLLRCGLALLVPETKWTDHFDLAFEITELLAKMNLIIGNLDECREMTKETLRRSKSVEMKTNSLLIDVEAAMVENKIDESLAIANRALKVLGIKLPHKVRSRHVIMKSLKLRSMLRGKSDEDILSLPLMADLTKSTAVKLLQHMCLNSLLKNELNEGAYFALLAAELTLNFGLSPYSANALTIYGVAELTLKNHDRAYRFHRLAMKMLVKIECKDAECFAMMGLSTVAHWREPLRDVERQALHALRCGFEVGDAVYGSFCAGNCFAIGVMLGENLQSLEGFMRSTYFGMKDLSQGSDPMLLWMQAGLQFVINLQSHATSWQEVTCLTGEIMDEDKYLEQADEANNPALKTIAWLYKAMLAYYFGFYATAVSLSGTKADQALHDTFAVSASYFFSAMSSYACFRNTGGSKHAKAARKSKKGLQRIESAGSMNASAYLTLLEAEELALKKSSDATKIALAYGRAIDAMAAERYVQMEALANERAAFTLAKVGACVDAERHFHRAMALYKTWGATVRSWAVFVSYNL